jgi:hypothetical protein
MLRWFLGILSIGAIGTGAYFSLRSREQRLADYQSVSDGLMNGIDATKGYASKLFHTEQTPTTPIQ